MFKCFKSCLCIVYVVQEGAFALAFKSIHFPGEIVVARYAHPLMSSSCMFLLLSKQRIDKMNALFGHFSCTLSVVFFTFYQKSLLFLNDSTRNQKQCLVIAIPTECYKHQHLITSRAALKANCWYCIYSAADASYFHAPRVLISHCTAIPCHFLLWFLQDGGHVYL